MQWRLKQFIYDPATNLLHGPAGEILLEPKSSALLAYFIENSGRDISRDELIKSVWHGQIVSDGAINRVVVHLRKALGDDGRIKRFIVTVPKVGYRFVVEAQETETAEKPAGQGKAEHRVNIGSARGRVVFLALTAGVLAVLAYALVPGQSRKTPTAPATHAVSPLTRLNAEQFDPAMADDATQLAYSRKTEAGADLFWVKSADVPPLPIGKTGGFAVGAAWAPGAQALVYQFVQGTACAFHMIEFSGKQASPPETLYECAANSRSVFAFDDTGTKLYFTEQASEHDPSAVFVLDLENGSKTRLSQPPARGRGNHHIDINPQTGTLLVLGDQKPGRTTAFELDPASNSFTRLHDWSFRVDHAVFGHSANTIVHPGTHPSYQLVETNYASGKARVLVSDSRRIKTPKRIANNRDYLFASYLHNRDIWIDGQPQPALNSSVMDYLPTLSRGGSKLAFVSKRTGQSEIWIKDFPSDTLQSIAIDQTGLSIVGLDWSFDDQSIVATTSQGLWVVDTVSGHMKSIPTELPAYATSWTGDNRLVYSQRENGRWHIYETDTLSGATKQVYEGWAFLLASEQLMVFVDQEGAPFLGGTSSMEADCAPPLAGRHLAFHVRESVFYCVSNQDRRNLLKFVPGIGVETLTNMVPGVKQYSVAGNRIAHTVPISRVSDIMRTDQKAK